MRTRLRQSSSDSVSSLSASAQSGHRSVLLHEAIDRLEIRADDCVADLTLGGAGHARAITERLGKSGTFIGFDLDPEAVERARASLKTSRCTVHLVEGNFRHLDLELAKLSIPLITKALFDLGWSGYQLDAGRGFSFLKDEPLLMTYGKGSALNAKTIVNEWAETSLADIIFGWGEERYARRIARTIVERREEKPFESSRDLAETIKAAVPASYRHGRIHPATRTFQALRIAVNDELGSLSQGLEASWRMLAEGGRIAVISFHSIEDRIVKQMFVKWEKEGQGKRVTKKPIVPGAEELKENPRARSAKLRVIEKTEMI